MRGNNVNIKGNLTRDAEVKRTDNGSTVVKFGLAWNKPRKDPSTGQYEDVPHYFDCQCWVTDGQLRAIENRLVKGARCAVVDGHLEYQSWEQNGQRRSRVVVCVDDPINGLLVEPAHNEGEPEPPAEPPASVYDEDIPF